MPERDDLRQFMRDIAARHERVWRDQLAKVDRTIAGLDEVERALRDVREESNAHTQALLRVLDRLENGGAQA